MHCFVTILQITLFSCDWIHSGKKRPSSRALCSMITTTKLSILKPLSSGGQVYHLSVPFLFFLSLLSNFFSVSFHSFCFFNFKNTKSLYEFFSHLTFHPYSSSIWFCPYLFLLHHILIPISSYSCFFFYSCDFCNYTDIFSCFQSSI